MIDMTFLLLIFFMVTSTMQSQSQFQLPPSKHGLGVDTKDAIYITITKGDPDPNVILAKDVNKAPSRMSDVKNYVVEQKRANKRNVIINADRDVPSGFVREVARLANEVEDVGSFFIAVIDKHQ